jgi:hypothetical protein
VLGFFRQIGKLVGVARESADALDVAKQRYGERGTLPEILEDFTAETTGRADDGLRDGVLEALQEAAGTLKDVAELLDRVSEQASAMVVWLDAVRTLPLRDVLEDGRVNIDDAGK